MGNSVSRMSFERASVLVDPQEISQLAVAFTHFGDDNDRVTLNSFQKNFVRPSKSVRKCALLNSLNK